MLCIGPGTYDFLAATENTENENIGRETCSNATPKGQVKSYADGSNDETAVFLFTIATKTFDDSEWHTPWPPNMGGGYPALSPGNLYSVLSAKLIRGGDGWIVEILGKDSVKPTLEGNVFEALLAARRG